MQFISLSVGYMEQLDGKWILVKDTKCPEKDSSPATLGLTNMAGNKNNPQQCIFVPRLNEVEGRGLLNYPSSVFPSVRLE